MVKVFKGFRFDPELYERFKEVADRDRLMVTEAFKRYMRASVDARTVKLPEPKSRGRSGVDAEARVLLAWLRKGQTSYWINEDKEVSIHVQLLQMLTKVEDEALQEETEQQLQKS
jgi:hypothetical protein